MNKTYFSIIFGGESTEHDASRKGFEYLYERLKLHPLENFTLDEIIYITRDGKAAIHKADFSKESTHYEFSEELVDKIDAYKHLIDKKQFIYSILHGQNGEDGHAQGVAEYFDIPGSFGGLISCSIGMSKYHLNRYVSTNFQFVKIPETVCIRLNDNIKEKLDSFRNATIVVKPNSLGASIMTEKFIYNDQNQSKIIKLINKILLYDVKVLVQEYVRGIEYSCACLEMNGEIKILPLVRIETKNNFFGHKEKHISGYSREVIIDKNEDTKLIKDMKRVAQDIFADLDFQNAVRFDFIVSDNTIFFLEANPLPGIMKNSIFPKMLRTQGMDVENLIEIFYKNEQSRPKVRTKLVYKID